MSQYLIVRTDLPPEAALKDARAVSGIRLCRMATDILVEEALELQLWDQKPERFVGYFAFPETAGRLPVPYRPAFKPSLAGAQVTTRLGTPIGDVVRVRVTRHSRYWGRMVSLRVQGTNGAEYWGRALWDHGSSVVLRRAGADAGALPVPVPARFGGRESDDVARDRDWHHREPPKKSGDI